MPIKSDPATQLHGLCTKLMSVNSQERPSIALGQFLGVEPSGPEYFMALGAISARFQALEEIYESVLQDEPKSLALYTLAQLQNFMNADLQRTPWSQVAAQVFNGQNMVALMMSSTFVRTVAPITVPTADEIESAVRSLDDAIEALAGYHGAISVSLRSSLISTKKLMARFEVYGVDALTEQLLRAFAVRTVADQEPNVPPAESKARKSAWGALALIATLLVEPDSVITAVENHYSRSQAIIEMIVGEQKLLPAPAKKDGEPNNANAAIIPKEPEESEPA